MSMKGREFTAEHRARLSESAKKVDLIAYGLKTAFEEYLLTFADRGTERGKRLA